MTLVPWGNLKKSAVDDETIEQAIDRLIAVHEADETSHLGAGESLQSHKASEIIDHVAASIVEDKIADRVVSTEKLSDFARGRYSLSMESKDGWYYEGTVVVSPGQFYLNTGSNSNDFSFIYGNDGPAPKWDKSFKAQCIFKTLYNTEQAVYVAAGSVFQNDPEDQCVGFKITDAIVKAIHRWSNGSSVYEVETTCSGISPLDYHVYRIEFTVGVDIKFYIDDVLVATHSSNLPSTDYPCGSMFTIRVVTTDSNAKHLRVRQLYYAEDL